MKFIFGVVGAILGLLMGELIGGLIGLGVGIGLASMMQKSDKANASKTAAAAPAQPTAAKPSTPPPLPMETRVARLEQEVAMLRAEVKRLSQAPVATAAPASVSVSEPLAFDLPDLAPAPMAAPIPEAAPASFSLPALEPAPAPTPVNEQPDTQPLPLDVPTPAQAATPAAAPTPARPPAPRPAPVPQPTLQERLPPFLSKLIFGGNTIVKVGVLILFLGLAFLLRYAAERVTVPVELRYAGVALLGAVLLVLGWRLRERKDGYGLILQGAGIGVFYLTTLAALKISHLLPAELAFGFLLAVTLLSAVLAMAQNAPWLAYVAAAEGFAAPVLVSTGSGNHIALFSYLAVLDVGIFLMAWFRAWRPLNLIGAVGTFALAGAWAHKHYTDAHYPSTQAFLLFFFVLFTLVGVLFARRALAQGDEPDARRPISQRAAQTLAQVGRVDSTLAFGVPLASYGLQYLMVRGWEFGPAWAAVGFALFYLLLGGVLLRGGNVRYALLGEAYVIVAVIFGTLAIPLALEGEWTGATWAVEAAGMFWLGVRQQRRYARAFALLVLAAATLRLVSALGFDFSPGTPLFTGSVLGVLMLSASAFAMFFVARRAAVDQQGGWEAAGVIGQLWIGLAALALAAWLLLVPQWACVATSLLAFACAWVQARKPLPALQWASAALHAVALAGFASTLHALHGQAMLSNGWQGLVAATVIGVSLLASTWLPLSAVLREAEAKQAAPQWSVASSIGLLAGVGALSSSLLFVMPADIAARVWPWLGLLALWLGLRLRHPALAVAWGALQPGSALAFFVYGPALWAETSTGLTLWTPLVLTLAGLISGDALQRSAKLPRAVPWQRATWLHWGVVLWGLAWWSQVLLPDAWRHLLRTQKYWVLLWPAVLTGWVLVTSVVVTGVARWRDWRVLGQTAWATVPAWVCTPALGMVLVGAAPHQHLGWLVWPLALAWHVVLLRALSRWWSDSAIAPLHVGGFWLFLLLAAREAQWLTAGWGEAGSAWPVLGWVLVPALVLAAITRPAVLQRWPLTTFRMPYLVVACVPVALYLLLWLWVGNTQEGETAPLPYVPLLNPLEAGQGLVLLSLFLWHRALPAGTQLPRQALLAGLGATAFALYTGMVLRTCHHWAGVPWESGALMDSTLTQAALSVAWAIVGVALMMLGHKRVERAVWVVGAALLAVVVLKLFFVELADSGGLYRIVSFIVVGLLLLLVGYFAPVPPSRKEAAHAA
ncbi:DUF2339 domain-containing protein [Piscinibacter sp. HJYY11]|uniref:DUF2339 domain-containing protein n=1 Tax=Piscinibacter sp. HJYY11 TaxID=2801333 RepID=UPI00191D9404|nr:DUF2339 domain-containing protein [Piscinibacter sp. HJYY11]MBL0727103.1 DUF2339 domain-containing protein [Piscinibacter sp. HJYY11]